MKKLILISIIGLLLFGNVLNAQNKVAICVIGGNDSGINKVLADKLVESFVKSGRYTAIERSSSFLSELSKEQKFKDTGSFNDNDLVSIAKTLEVDLICVSEVSEVLGEKYVSARLINVETTEIITTSNSGSIIIKTMPDLIILSDKIASELSGKTGKELYKQTETEAMQNEIANTINQIAQGVSGILEGTIVLTNKDKDPFDIYINNKYIGVIQGYTTIQKNVPKGNYSLKVVERSGYLLNQQIELFNINVKTNKASICRWE